LEVVEIQEALADGAIRVDLSIGGVSTTTNPNLALSAAGADASSAAFHHPCNAAAHHAAGAVGHRLLWTEQL
jgi:hypothetical protein